jgi:hypothetical protein
MVWITTQFKSISSPQNNDKIPNTTMHTSLKQYSGFDLSQTMRATTSDLEVEMVLMLGMVKTMMKMLFPMPRRSRWQRWRRFPTCGSSRTPGVLGVGIQWMSTHLACVSVWPPLLSSLGTAIDIPSGLDALMET